MTQVLTDPDVDAHGLVARQRRFLRGLVALFVVTVIGLGVSIYVQSHRTSPWNPLGPFPAQTVLNVGHTVAPGRTVHAIGTKCSKEAVTTRGIGVNWQLLDPEGTLVHAPNSIVGVGALPKGCVTKQFDNPVPDAVTKRVAELCAATGKPSSWKLVGKVTPFRDSGDGVPLAWASEPFLMTCPP